MSLEEFMQLAISLYDQAFGDMNNQEFRMDADTDDGRYTVIIKRGGADNG